MRSLTCAAAAAIASLTMSAAWNAATAQALPAGTVWSANSAPKGSCPGFDWHVVAGPAGKLDGMMSWDNMKSVALLTGTESPDRKITMTATEQGGQGRTATITGVARGDGWLVLDFVGPGVACKEVKIQITRRGYYGNVN